VHHRLAVAAALAVTAPAVLAPAPAAAQGAMVPAPAPAPGSAPGSGPPAKRPPALATPALAGQAVAVLPLTLAGTDPALAGDSTLRALGGRRAGLAWADSIIGAALEARAPEVSWTLPARLRQLARRNPGMVPDPDRMGQAVLRSPKLKRVPEPLASALRNLTAVTGGRYAMVPAALGLARDATGGVRADLALALADARSGQVVWRALSSATAASPAEAVSAAVANVLPGP